LALDYVRAGGREWATGRLDATLRDRAGEAAVREALARRIYRSPVRVSDDLVPQITVAVPQIASGVGGGAVVATVDLTERWQVIDKLRVGEGGYARVVGQGGQLLAIGNNALKRRVFTQEKDTASPLVDLVLAGKQGSLRYAGFDGNEVLGVG